MQLRLFPDKFEIGQRVKLASEPPLAHLLSTIEVGSKGTIKPPPYVPESKGWLFIRFDDASYSFWVHEKYVKHI